MLKRVEARDIAGINQLLSELASSDGLTPGQAREVVDAVATRMAGQIQRMTLSRGGLADVVSALGDARFVTEAGGKDQNAALLHFLFGSEERVRALIAAASHRAGISMEQAGALVPKVVHAQFSALVERSRPALTDIFGRMPSLFQWSLGSMHADIGDIIRRGCGAGPYGRVVLRRRVRAILARATGYSGRGPLGWYLRTVLAPARAIARQAGKVLK